MKLKTAALLWSFLLSAILPAAGRLSLDTVSPRQIAIGTEPAITLVKKGKICFEVVKPENPAAGQAANVLIDILQQITGQKITPVTKASGNCPAFYLGVNSETRKLGITPEKLDRDGFYIRTNGQRIFIIGADEAPGLNRQTATLFGLYDFLERFAGVRFYFPGEIGTIIPRKQDWNIPEINIAERPDVPFRWIYCYPCSRLTGAGCSYRYPGQGDSDTFAAWRNGSLTSVRSCHGLNDLELPKRFAKTHPEYFALSPDGKRRDGSDNHSSYHIHGHLCYSSEGLKEEIYQDAAACLTGRPASSRGISRWSPRWNRFHVNITPNDGLLWCQCPKCRKIEARGKQAMSNHIWRFAADIALKLKGNGIPGKVLMDSYGVYSLMPELEIPDNILVNVMVTGPWDEGNAGIKARDNQRIKDWSQRLHARIGTWTYPTKACAEVASVPNFTPRAVGKFFKAQKSYIFGSFFEAGSDRWLFGFMNAYVFSKLLWDWNTDVEKLLAEHCSLMYGAAAPQMGEIYAQLEELWIKHVVKDTVQTSWGENWQVPTRRDIWTKIYSPAKIAEINQLFDAAEQAAAGDPASLKRVRFMRRELWGPVLAGAAAYRQESSDRTLWTMNAGPAGKMVLDGKLTEPAWQSAGAVWLVPAGPEQKAEVQTRVKFLQDAENFYIGIEADEPETGSMEASHRQQSGDSDIWRDNGIEVFLAPSFDSDFIYQFIVNSTGATADLRNVVDKIDESYESGFASAVAAAPGKNWSVEIRIPRRSVPELKGPSLAANFTRTRKLKNRTVETGRYVWRPWKRNIAENCGLLHLTAVPDKNLIQTGDFDRPLRRGRFIGSGEWGGNRELSLDHTVFLTAGASLCLDEKSEWVRQALDLKNNQKYRLSFYIRTENLQPGMRAMIRYGGNGANGFYVLGNYLDYIRGTTPWQRIECTFVTPGVFGNQYKPHLEFSIGGKSRGKCWIDHVELLELAPDKKN